MHHIMNFFTGRGVRTHVMHKCRSWTVFSASLLGFNGMLVVRQFRHRLLILSVSIVGFFISTFSAVLALDFSGPVVSVLDGDTLEVLHNNHAERIRLPQSQRHPKERRDPLTRKNGEAHILACYFASYGNHKIRAAIPTKMATKIPGIIATSMRTS